MSDSKDIKEEDIKELNDTDEKIDKNKEEDKLLDEDKKNKDDKKNSKTNNKKELDKDNKDKDKKEKKIKKSKSVFNDFIVEYKKIVWPSFKSLCKQTYTVIITCLFFGAIIFCVDAAYGFCFEYMLNLLSSK